MMKIKLLHLYYDLLNMYGENGNMVSFSKELEKQGLDIKIDFKSLNDNIRINDYDFIYIGCGDTESYNLALNDLSKYKDDLKEYINNNKYILATGNSLNLFSDLEILDFKYKMIDFRIIGEQIYNYSDINKKVIGFQNRDSVIISSNENKLFDVISGTGYDINSNIEGIRKNNFFGTYLLGPIMVRNPYLQDYIVKSFLKDNKIKYKKLDKGISYQAYEEFLKNFVKE